MAAAQPSATPIGAHARTVPLPSGGGADFKYACSIALPAQAGQRVNGEILINAHFDFIVRRVTWDYFTRTGIPPKVRLAWRDNRRSYLDRKALIGAVFGNPGDDYPFTTGLLLRRGNTISFELDTLEDNNEGSIDIVLHGVELRPQDDG